MKDVADEHNGGTSGSVPRDIEVFEDPVTKVWRFELDGRSVEVEPRRGYVKIDGQLHWDERLENLTEIGELDGPPLVAIVALVQGGESQPVRRKRRPLPVRVAETRRVQPSKVAGPTPTVDTVTQLSPVDDDATKGAASAKGKSRAAPRAQSERRSGRRQREEEGAAAKSSPPQPAETKTPSADTSVLTTAAAAAYVGLSPKTLETKRVRGGGPPFLKLGRRVVYRTEDLDDWLESGAKRSTSDSGEEPSEPKA